MKLLVFLGLLVLGAFLKPVTSDTDENPTTTTAPTTTTTTPQTTSKGSTTPTAAPAVTPSTPVDASASVLISETNLLLAADDDDLFVELSGTQDATWTNLMLVIVDATSSLVVQKHTYRPKDNFTTPQPSTSFYVQHIAKASVENLTSVAVVLYSHGASIGQNFTGLDDVQDFVVLATDHPILAPIIKDTLLHGGAPVALVSKSLGGSDTNLSFSRFVDDAKDNSAFVVALETKGKENNITLTQDATNFTLQLHATGQDNCTGLETKIDEVRNQLVTAVNGLCQCGLSTRQIHGTLQCKKDLFFKLIVKQSFPQQDFESAFRNFVQKTTQFIVSNKNYTVVNCTQDCQVTTPPTSPTVTSTVTPSSSASHSTLPGTTTAPAHSSASVLISETNLLLADKDLFVELTGKETATLTGLTLVIVNASSSAVVNNFTYGSDESLSAGFIVYSIPEATVANLTSVAVVLYSPGANIGQNFMDDVQDFVVLATDYPSLAANIKEDLLHHGAPVALVSKGLGGSDTILSFSRFVDDAKDNSAFVLALETKGKENNITLTQDATNFTLQLHATGQDNCTGLETQSDEVRNQLVTAVNGLCQCGLSTRQIHGTLQCKKDLFFLFNMKETFPQQGFKSSFSDFVQKDEQFTVSNKTFTVISCTHDCQVTTPTASPTGTPIVTPSSPQTTTTPAHSSASVVISETNLLLADKDLFVELTGDKTATLTGLTLVIMNASSTAVVNKFIYGSDESLSTGFNVHSIPEAAVAKLTSVAVVLYSPGADINQTELDGAQDFVVLATGDASLAANIKEVLPSPVALVSKGLADNGTSLSLSRFMENAKDNSAFVVAPETKDASNKINLIPDVIGLTLQLRTTGDYCKASEISNSVNIKVRNKLVAAINSLCSCGLSPRQISGKLQCQTDLFFHFNVSQSFPHQSFASAFSHFVQTNQSFNIGQKQYSVFNCTRNCQKTTPHIIPGNNSDKGNIKVTVAVVMSCIVIFLFILIAVIFYMRKKRRGIMRQFRMTRLQEDDDMDDMEDFIGGYDQEPSFSSSRNNLTTN